MTAITGMGMTLVVHGDNVYRYFHHEIGVHKVQRVPVTNAAGKMQTSTACVTLMPVLDPLSVNVREEECKIDYVRGSGPGGQGMQSSSNCVVLTHLPSGIRVKCHQSRSALGNKELALQSVANEILTRRVREQKSKTHNA
uniref:Peptide chain release factor 1 n=1 Tax=Lygus hesperus TaxID=30085 RepID=A0A0A9YWZ8_LYGHE